jgi:MoaA/NifB/PqqE/SkfB family radical SAM enzyme
VLHFSQGKNFFLFGKGSRVIKSFIDFRHALTQKQRKTDRIKEVNMIQLILTQKCNFRCAQCMWSCNSKGRHMTEEVFLEALPYMQKAKAVNVVGGEPSLHPTCRTYMQMIASVVKQMRFVTNGSWINRSGFITQTLITSSKKLGFDNLLVRISNDAWHRQFISENAIEGAGRLLRRKGVNEAWNRMDNSVVYPLGRALHNKIYIDLRDNNILHAPAECTKRHYEVWDNLSIDVNGDISICPHHQAICGNIMSHTMEDVVRNADSMMKKVLSKHPTNADCSSCLKH